MGWWDDTVKSAREKAAGFTHNPVARGIDELADPLERKFEQLLKKAKEFVNGAPPTRAPPATPLPEAVPFGPPPPPPEAGNKEKAKKHGGAKQAPPVEKKEPAKEKKPAPKPPPEPQVSAAPQGGAPPAAGAGKPAEGILYTEHENERVVTTTTIDLADLLALFRKEWPEVGEHGVRCLAAQFLTETGNKNIYNWNYGNVKSGPGQPHMYLYGTWEVKKNPKAPNGLPDNKVEELLKDPKWGNGKTNVKGDAIIEHPVVIRRKEDETWCASKGYSKDQLIKLNPPHPGSRFRAFETREEGVAFFVGKHKKMSEKVDKKTGKKIYPEYFDALKQGDLEGMNSVLVKSKYYTAKPEKYLSDLRAHKARVDARFGAVP